MRQAQDSVTDQMARAVRLVEDAGLYDAADWIRHRWYSRDVAPAAHEPKEKEDEGRSPVPVPSTNRRTHE